MLPLFKSKMEYIEIFLNIYYMIYYCHTLAIGIILDYSQYISINLRLFLTFFDNMFENRSLRMHGRPTTSSANVLGEARKGML
jgi:hypothetical protein